MGVIPELVWLLLPMRWISKQVAIFILWRYTHFFTVCIKNETHCFRVQQAILLFLNLCSNLDHPLAALKTRSGHILETAGMHLIGVREMHVAAKNTHQVVGLPAG